MLVAFSCKLRGVCPSCGARRASQTAANLVDRVLPHVPLRQWVLSVPYELRLPMARSPALLSAVVRILCAEISQLLRRLGQERGVRQGTTGMVATIQLFGGSPTQSEIAEVTRRVQARVLRELERRGMLLDPNDARNDAENEPIMGRARGNTHGLPPHHPSVPSASSVVLWTASPRPAPTAPAHRAPSPRVPRRR
jgi:hypothetical protein